MSFKRISALMVCLLILSSCVKEKEKEEELKGTYPVLKAFIPDTKTTLNGTQLRFKVGDGLSVFNGVVSNTDHHGHCKYECTSVDDQGVATFEYVDDASVNPYRPSAELQQIVATHPNRSGSTSEFEPEEDGYGEGTVKIRMVAGPVSVSRNTGFDGTTVPIIACAEKGEMLSFKVTCGLLCLSLSGEGSIAKITVESDRAISGEASVQYSSDEPSLTVTGTGRTITCTYGTGRTLSSEGTLFYFGLPVGSHDLTFTFHDTEGNSMTKKASGLRVERARMVNTALEYEPDTAPSNLSANGQYANCYVVGASGTYCFDAVKPSGEAVEGTSALWVWASGEKCTAAGTLPSSMMSGIRYADGKIYFTVPESMAYGNVVLGVVDSEKNLLYTWHIWLAQELSDVEVSGVTVMDRNLGAAYRYDVVSAVSNTTLQHGRGNLYQWGRKDPILGIRNSPQAIENPPFANGGNGQTFVVNTSASIKNVDVWSAGNDFGARTAEAGASHPLGMAASSKVPGLVDGDVTTTWSKRDNANPCPFGYRVMNDLEFAAVAGVSAEAQYKTSSSVSANFSQMLLSGKLIMPRGGYRNAATGGACYAAGNGSMALFYSDNVSAGSASQGMTHKFLWTSNASYSGYSSEPRDAGDACNVRCVRDNSVMAGGIAALPSKDVSVGGKLKVASYNIWSPGGRVGASGAKTDELKEILKWEKAYCAVADCINFNSPDVIGLNEVTIDSYSLASFWGYEKYPYNIQALLPAYEWLLFDENGNRVTTDSPTSGIYGLSEAILYNPSKVSLEECGYFLTGDESLFGATVHDYATSSDVDICTEGRHCIWAKFTHLETGCLFYVFNLHNDLTFSYTDSSGSKIVDERSQCANARTVLAKAEEIVADGMPAVILGDFNATAGNTSFEYFRSSGRWEDAYEVVATREGTYIASGKAITTMNSKDNENLSYIRPDHILVDSFNVLSYSVDRGRYESTDGTAIFPSDHFLIKSTLSF